MKTITITSMSGLPNCYRVGQMIYFRLDGKREGEGILKSGNWEGKIYRLQVRLTKPCKEFSVGDVITIDNSEVI